MRALPVRLCILFCVAAILSEWPLPVAASASERSLPVAASVSEPTSSAPRRDTLLDSDWRTIALDTGAPAPAGVESTRFDDRSWRVVDVPHNWDEYEGFRQVRHGDRHGTAWYRLTFVIDPQETGRRLFLFFEGVGSYATVWLNGELVGRHAGGLTTFTLDITRVAKIGGTNLLVVRADHPAGIRDLPWVCGGCELAYGFSEGTQPFGLFRPVHLITTGTVRVEPFGVQVWNDARASANSAQLHVRTEIKNYGITAQTLILRTAVLDCWAGSPDFSLHQIGASADLPRRVVSELRTTLTLQPGETRIVPQEPPPINDAHLWSPENPALYTVQSEIIAATDAPEPTTAPTNISGRGEPSSVLDAVSTGFGIRTIHWPTPQDADGRLLLNGRPEFINGICDYEHNLGDSHAFTAEQVRARAREMEAAGFNAFRDAHHPHNLRFQQYWDADGLLWWAQFGAHVWFDNPAFRQNFKALLRDWVKERRNSPSLVLWGLQNESVLPTNFAEECVAIIRELDPTASTQRKITTCNGGSGTDWDVPQNWSGTYSGNPQTYADDLQRQHLVGEYGAWRSLGLHTEGGFDPKGPLSEDRMTALLETKVRLAETVRNKAAGHFMWLFTTHSNPGRNVGEHGEQAFDGIRPLDHISPANNKGLFTIWGEPTDAYAMYRSNYAPAATEPMVYIVSHTWPDRWTVPGRENGIVVYSNCDEVELFNDLGGESLGRRTRSGRGTHFTWDNVQVKYNLLYAEGRVGGKVVARDWVQLHALPAAPRLAQAQHDEPDLIAPRPSRDYLYRVNCGGPDYVDSGGHRWAADHDFRTGDAWGSTSWAMAYPNLSPRFGSQRKTYEPIAGTRDPALFQTFRYGRDQLRYDFKVPNGEYEVELYFAEPWYGDLDRQAFAGLPRDVPSALNAVPATGNPSAIVTGLNAAGWRLFDVAVNGTTVLHDLDLWHEAGRDRAVKKVVPVHVVNGRLELSFPRVAAGQAVISAIAISRTAAGGLPRWATPQQHELVSDLTGGPGLTLQHAVDIGDASYSDAAGGFTALPPELLEADWIRTRTRQKAPVAFTLTDAATVFVAVPSTGSAAQPLLTGQWDATDLTVRSNAAPALTYSVYRNAFAAGARVSIAANEKTHAEPARIVFIVPRRPPPPPQYIREVAAVAGANAAWVASGSLAPGRDVYGPVRITKLPDALADADLLSPARDIHAGVAFTVISDADIYVALDPRITSAPAWLDDWVDTHQTVTTTDSAAPKFALYRRRAKPGERVTLGATDPLRGLRYFALVRAVRPSVLLPASTALLSGASVVGGNKDVPMSSTSPAVGGPVLLSPGEGHSITWTVSVGVGDRYGLDFRFTAPTATPVIPGDLTIVDHDGHALRTDKLVFPAVTEPGRWTFLRTRTGASINAGTYRLRLILRGSMPLLIDSLEIE